MRTGPVTLQLHRAPRPLQEKGNRVRGWLLGLLVLASWSAVHVATQCSLVALASSLQLSSPGTVPTTLPPLLLGLAVLPGPGLASLCGLPLQPVKGLHLDP